MADLELTKFVQAVFELAVNAVRHGGGTGELTLYRDDTHLWCRVSDRGRGMPKTYTQGARRVAPDRLGGWGLWLVRQVCPLVTVSTARTGTVVLMGYPAPNAADRAAPR